MLIIETENFDKIEDVIIKSIDQLSIDDREVAKEIFKKINDAQIIKAFGLESNSPLQLKVVLYSDEVSVLIRCMEIANE